MRIVHVQTTIQTVFGTLDDDGNVIPQQPVVVNVGLFKPEAFVSAYEAIAQARDSATAESPAERDAAPPVARNGNGNRQQRRAAAKAMSASS